MDKFKASNGATVNETPYPGFKMLTVKTPDNTITLAGVHVDALREFFQHERDEELGRWRWPDNPDYVVYQDTPSGVRVFREQRPVGSVLFRRGDVVLDMESEAARAYFEAHPERKPWEDANPGEIWEATIDDGTTYTVFVCENRNAGGREGFTPEGKYFDTDGRNQGVIVTRRVYPAGD